jgi:hypothetical protein
MNILLNHSNSSPDYNYVIKELQNYMFTEENINIQVFSKPLPKPINSLEENPLEKESLPLSNLKKENNISLPLSLPLPLKREKKEQEQVNCIKEKDSLFWSFYTMVNGDVAYELLKPIHLVKEKKIKIEYIEKLRQNKVLLKQHKFASLVHIENQLLNETKIDLNTFFSLCVLENINIFYVYKKTFYELILNDSNSTFIVYRDNIKYTFEKIIMIGSEKIEKYRKEWYKIDVLNKPIKSLSSYKLQELVDFCNKLNLDIINKETNKPKKKQELYEAIVQNLS